MRFLGFIPFPILPSVLTLPQLLLLPSFYQSSLSSMSIATWFLVVLATAAIDTPASTVPPLQENKSPHIVAQFPVGDGQQYGFYPLDPNTTREGALRFNHLTVDPTSGRLYAGAVNRLLQLDSNLKLEEYVSTGPRLDNPQCHPAGCPSRDITTSLTDNVNKLLIADLESRTLIACGSLLQGACEKYKMSNISIKPEFIPHSVAANDENSSTYAFIGPKRYGPWGQSNILYVGTTFTNRGDYRHYVPAISSRNLQNFFYLE